MKRSAFCLPVLLLAASISFYCAKEVRQKPVNGVKAPDKIETFCPSFEEEGFINGSVYRIVIVVPKGSAGADMSSMIKTAKLRALSSLQKFLISESRIVDQNTTAELLSLLEGRGKLENTNCPTESRDIYYYTVERDNLREYILSLAKKR